MSVRIDSKFKIILKRTTRQGVTLVKHNNIEPFYETLLRSLFIAGSAFSPKYYDLPVWNYQPFQTYPPTGQRTLLNYGVFPPANIYFTLLNNGNVVKLIPAQLKLFNENFNTISTSGCNNDIGPCNLQNMPFYLGYEAIDESSDTYTFNEIVIVAGSSPTPPTAPPGNAYSIAYTNVNSITKNNGDVLGISWLASVTISSNNVFYLPGCTDLSLTYSNNLGGLVGFEPYLCVNIPYIIVGLSLIPYSQIPPNSFLYQQVNNLLGILKITTPVTVPLGQLLNFLGISHQVIGNVAYLAADLYSINSQSQSSTVTYFLLYGINSHYFIYTLPQTQTLQPNLLYVPKLDVIFEPNEISGQRYYAIQRG
jgi:hypothetical protein